MNDGKEIMRIMYCEACDGYEVEWNGANDRVPALDNDEDVAEALRVCAEAKEEIEELEVALQLFLLRNVEAPRFPH